MMGNKAQVRKEEESRVVQKVCERKKMKKMKMKKMKKINMKKI